MRHRLNFRPKLRLGSAVELKQYAKDQGFPRRSHSARQELEPFARGGGSQRLIER